VFSATAVSQDVQHINHLVMATDERLIDSGRFHDTASEMIVAVGSAGAANAAGIDFGGRHGRLLD
jgi:hypothetical protein